MSQLQVTPKLPDIKIKVTSTSEDLHPTLALAIYYGSMIRRCVIRRDFGTSYTSQFKDRGMGIML